MQKEAPENGAQMATHTHTAYDPKNRANMQRTKLLLPQVCLPLLDDSSEVVGTRLLTGGTH